MSETDVPTNSPSGPDFSGAFNPHAFADEPPIAPLAPVAAAPEPFATPEVTAPAPQTPSTPDVVKEPTASFNPAAPDVLAPTDPAPAPVAAESTPQAAVAEPTVTEHDQERAALIASYAARRRRYTWLAVAAVVIGVWLIKPWNDLTLPGNPLTSQGKVHSTTQAAKPRDLIEADMGRVHRRLARSGDLTGMHLAGAEVAASGKSLYAARIIGEQCIVYGIAEGQDIVPAADPNGTACHGDQVKAVQRQLDTADRDRRTADVEAATTLVTDAADTAAFYAKQNYTAGAQSLTGLDESSLGGATIVRNHGDWLELKGVANGTCRTAIVTATGQLGEISSCRP